MVLLSKNIEILYLTDGIFETGAYGVLIKSPTVLGQGGPSSTQGFENYLVPCMHQFQKYHLLERLIFESSTYPNQKSRRPLDFLIRH